MNSAQFIALQDFILGFLWLPIEVWMVPFVAGGVLLALYEAMMRIVRERLL